MIAKIAIAIGCFVALSPQILTLSYRILFIAVAVGSISGLVGTATRLEPATMIPVNMGYAALVSIAVTGVLHFATEAVRGSYGNLKSRS
ncbi:hypothetical protein [Enterovirga sp. CN4-39]|uniref:hypothetical protein n=1 Tax=Enterovirga sp. CN4-39 TaxID=3400910 RepID=UPI003C0362B7